MEQNKEIFWELDLLRAFACLAVIGIHTFANFLAVKEMTLVSVIACALDNICSFAVPLFIFISGFVLYKNYKEKIPLKKYYKKRTFSVLPQYIFFSLFYLIASDWNNIIDGTTSLSIKSILVTLFQGKASYHLWFFTILIQLYIFFPLFLRLFKYVIKKNITGLFLICMLLFQIIWYIFYFKIIDLFSDSSWLINFLKSYEFIFGYIFYLFSGMYICEHFKNATETMKKIKFGYFLLACFFMWAIYTMITIQKYFTDNGYLAELAQILLQPITSILFCIILYKFSVYIKNKNNIIYKALSSISKYSFGIYLIHIGFLYVIQLIMRNLEIDPITWNFYPILYFSTLIFSYIAVRLISYLPFSKYIVGIHNKIK